MVTHFGKFSLIIRLAVICSDNMTGGYLSLRLSVSAIICLCDYLSLRLSVSAIILLAVNCSLLSAARLSVPKSRHRDVFI